VLEDRAWWREMSLLLPRSGSAAVAYAKGFPSRAVAAWMVQRVTPGATVVDVGAHAGVYSLLAARLAGETGRVHAIEPQQDVLSLLMRSAEANALRNVSGHCIALLDSAGTAALSVDPRSGGAVATTPASNGQPVRAVTLDRFARDERLDDITLMKLDAAGNELSVIRGGVEMLSAGAIRTIICKLYDPHVIEERFGESGGDPSATVELLHGFGYRLELPGGEAPTASALARIFGGGAYTVPLLASAHGPGRPA
jgi:FkbM family methyltransferase